MPVSKKRKKEGRSGRREHAAAPAAPRQSDAERTGGFLSRMRGGFQSMAGTRGARKESLVSKIVTWAILLVALYFVARRFGILP